MNTQIPEPACPRIFGTKLRQYLKTAGIPAKVSCKTVSFQDLARCSYCIATIRTDEKIEETHFAEMAKIIREFRSAPWENGGGAAMINLSGRPYPFGGSIGHKDYLKS